MTSVHKCFGPISVITHIHTNKPEITHHVTVYSHCSGSIYLVLPVQTKIQSWSFQSEIGPTAFPNFFFKGLLDYGKNQHHNYFQSIL